MTKAEYRGKFLAVNVYIKKEEIIKRRANLTQASRKKKIIKIKL